MLINFIYALILGVAHFISDKVAEHKYYKTEIRSFAAGLSITYLLLYLLPELYGGVVALERLLFLFVLLGATTFHLLEKYIYQHKKRNKLILELKVFHAVFFFIYHFLIGIVLVSINAINNIAGILFFIPILFYTLVSQVSLSNLHAHITEKIALRTLLSGSTLLGVILATLWIIPTNLYFSLLAFIAGALLYNVMVEVVPKEKEGNILFFLFGMIVYLIMIFMLGGF
tara:strand:- start:116 stop:799 length:684 start_codon:yes stop_codon:yes gene_type:complete